MKVALVSYGFAEYCIQQAYGLARHCNVMLILPESAAADYQSLLDPAIDFSPFKQPRSRHPGRHAPLAAQGVWILSATSGRRRRANDV